MRTKLLTISLLLLLVASLATAKDFPQYCCTDHGVLGPYPNESVREGEACYGHDSSGKRREGQACYGEHENGEGGSNENGKKDEYPSYCCTTAGMLGPYANDSVREGGACYGTDAKGRRHEGKACFSEEDAGDDGDDSTAEDDDE